MLSNMLDSSTLVDLRHGISVLACGGLPAPLDLLLQQVLTEACYESHTQVALWKPKKLLYLTVSLSVTNVGVAARGLHRFFRM